MLCEVIYDLPSVRPFVRQVTWMVTLEIHWYCNLL
jgi:hypothetical protein